jgi:hypothetical protein
LLDHLYDLLEPDDNQALTEHLRQCVPCQAALGRAQQQRQLLAAAAKAEFAAVRFQAPARVPAAQAEPAHASAWHAGWVRWSVAAAVLLAIAGLGIPLAVYRQQQQRVAGAESRYDSITDERHHVAIEYRDNVDAAGKEIQSILQEIQTLPTEHQLKLNAVNQEIASKQLKMEVTGPEKIEPGAANPYQVRISNRLNQPARARISARVLDQNGKEVYKQDEVQTDGTYQLKLPRDLPLKPHTQLSLVVSAKGDNGPQGELHEKLSLAAPLYITHLATDKPMYQPGEVVHFRSLTLERFSLKPVQEDLHLIFTLTTPMGDKVQLGQGVSQVIRDNTPTPILGPDHKPVRGIGAGEYQIDPNANGGEFTVSVSEANNRFQPQERKFLVNRYEKPRLNKELEFTKKSYGPGEVVVAACKVARVEAGPSVANRPVYATVNIDGKIYGADGKPSGAQLLFRTDADGAVNVKFQLPVDIAKGEASLAVNFTDGASNETMVRSIPIVLKKLQVEFYPEGGDMVAGLPNRVYFQARTTLDKPAELKGRIVDDQKHEVASDVQTLNDPKEPGANQGMGRFAFTPRAGRKYQLMIDSPPGIEGTYALPDVKADGVVLSVPEGVSGPDDPIRVVVRSANTDRALVVGAYCRGRVMDHRHVDANKNEATEVVLKPASGVGGVYRVTVFEELAVGDTRRELVPRAERLIYRKPAERLNIAIQPDKAHYVPGEHVKLVCVAKNEKDEPVPTVLLLAVTDKSVIKLADEKTFRSMPTHFLLTSEVRKPADLEHADFFLTDKTNAAPAVDLLLGTQGWRRFAEQDPAKFRKDQPQEADRLLVSIGQLAPSTLAPKTTDFEQQKIQDINKQYRTRVTAAGDRLVQANEHDLAARKDVARLAKIERLKEEGQRTRQEYTAALGTLNHYRELAGNSLRIALPVLAVVLLLAGVASLIMGLNRRQLPQALPYFMTAACSILLCGFVGTLVAINGDEISLAKESSKLGADRAQDRELLAQTAQPAMDPRVGAGGMGAPQNEAAALGAGPGGGQVLEMQQADGAKLQKLAEAAKGAMPEGKADLARNGLRDDLREKMKDRGEAFDKMPPRFAVPLQRKEVLRREAGKPGAAHGARGFAPRMADGKQKRELELAERAPLAAMPAPAGAMGIAGGMQGGPGMGGRGGARGPMAGLMGGGMPAAPPAGMMGMGGVPQGNAAGLRGPIFMPMFREGRFGGADMAFALAPEGLPPQPPFVVREYAHQHTHGEADVRNDSTETLYWNPVVVLPQGKTEVSFDLSDSVTTFEVRAAGHTLDGRIGAVTAEVKSQKPFTVEPKLPIEVTASDKIDIPLAIANNTDEKRTATVSVKPTNLTLVRGHGDEQLTLDANARVRRLYRFQPTILEGDATLLASGGQGQGFGDSVERSFKVVPDGFPVVGSKSDMLERVARLDNDLVLPDSWVKGTLKFQVAVYPSTLADLQKGLEAMLREPCGCFEQTSTSNYPNLLILDYLKETDQAKPEIARRAKELLASGYQRLTSFECTNAAKNQREGYEWFGGTAPAHEALTAYGLLEFRDMARVYDVDKSMVERTRQYLVSQKDGEGGFKRNPRALDSFGGAPNHITNAYIVWALTESGKKDDVTKEFEALAGQAKTSADPYFLALVANAFLNRDRTKDGIELLKKLAGAQKPDGHLEATQTSITGSGGRDLEIEATALTVYAWLKAQRPDLFNKSIQTAVKWIGQQRGGYGGFGSTQSTILALKALIAYAKANKKTAEAGDLLLYVGDKVMAQKHFAAGAEEAIVLSLPEADKVLKAGRNNVRVEITGKSVFPYTATWSYQTLKPASAAGCPVGLSTRLDRATAGEGDTVRLKVKVENKSGKGQGMTVAIVGLPAGLTLPEDLKQLKDAARLGENGTKPGLISAFETRGRELILYWRDMAPDRKIEVNLDLICRVPGEYSGPASRAYLYYNADHKCWVDPLKMVIAAGKKAD